MKTWLIGYFGERETAQYLRNAGYDILTCNYRSRYGEIDIIAKKDGLTVFVEVKTRGKNAIAAPAEHVTYSKQRRIISTAMIYLAEKKTEEFTRFDVAEVFYETVDDLPKLISLNYIENAFET